MVFDERADMPSVAVVDDDEILTASIVALLTREGMAVTGYTSADDFVREAKAGRLRDTQLIFFDMHLGKRRNGDLATAADMIPYAKTFAPSAKILVFTHMDIELESCIRCVSLGAMGLVPKSENPDEFLRAAKVYVKAGNPLMASEAVIDQLWSDVKTGVKDGGLKWEMLISNLLSSIQGLDLIYNNRASRAGETDLVFENIVDNHFWRSLDSPNIVVECKHRSTAPETSDFWVLVGKVKAKANCKVGIMVSWKKVSRGFRTLQESGDGSLLIYALSGDEIAEAIAKQGVERSRFLSNTLATQI